MPNFRTKELSPLSLPATKDGVEFLSEFKQQNSTRLVLCKINESKFFITIKPAKQGFVIKGEKISKPAQIGLLQKALLAFKELFAKQIINEAVAVHKNRMLQKDEIILNVNSFEDDFEELNKKFKKIFIEIGFGSGRHLLYQASNNLDALVLGIEIYKPSIEQVAKLAKAQNLQNVKVINADARLVMALLDSNLVDKIFLHFPVPWPKAAHRRVASVEFAKECQRVLKKGGSFELRTDEKEYCTYTLDCFLNLDSPQIQIQKNANLEITSKYEARWKRLEKNIYDLKFNCEQVSKNRSKNLDLSFNNKINFNALIENFSNKTALFDGYFFHLERLYVSDDQALIRLSLGGFYAPEHCFLLIDKDGYVKYFLKMPLQTRENSLAHEALKEFLNAKYNKR